MALQIRVVGRVRRWWSRLMPKSRYGKASEGAVLDQELSSRYVVFLFQSVEFISCILPVSLS
jgi:hypothetical protein